MPPHKLFIFGLDKAGKTALKTLIRVGEPPKATLPTLAFDISNIIVNDIKISVWDAPGQIAYRKDWKQGYQKASILMFVIDVSKPERFEEVKKEFDNVIGDEVLKATPLLVCYHKMDIESAKDNLDDAKKVLNLDSLDDRNISEFETSIFFPKVAKIIKDKLAFTVALGQRF
jgi:small GTP-binding protein